MSYAEIGAMVKKLREELDTWRRVSEHLHTVLDNKSIQFRCECPRPSCQEMRTYLDTVKEPTIKESVEFTVNMMNSGEVNPDVVYPKGRYHGD